MVGVKVRVMAVLLMHSEPGTGRVARWYTRKYRFQQKCEEIGPLNNGGQGASASTTIAFALLFHYYSYSYPLSKEELTQNWTPTFLLKDTWRFGIADAGMLQGLGVISPMEFILRWSGIVQGYQAGTEERLCIRVREEKSLTQIPMFNYNVSTRLSSFKERRAANWDFSFEILNEILGYKARIYTLLSTKFLYDLKLDLPFP